MTDALLTVATISIEIGTLVGALVAWMRMPKARPRLAVFLGALAPLFLVYVYVVVERQFSTRTDVEWAFYAMWIMTFWLYLACAIIGVCLLFLKRPVGLVARFFVGLAAPVCVVAFVQFKV